MIILNPKLLTELVVLAEDCVESATNVGQALDSLPEQDKGITDLIGALRWTLLFTADRIHAATGLIHFVQRHPDHHAGTPTKRPEPPSNEGGDTPPQAR